MSRPKHNERFRQEVVTYVALGKFTIMEAAKHYHIHRNTITRWMKEYVDLSGKVRSGEDIDNDPESFRVSLPDPRDKEPTPKVKDLSGELEEDVLLLKRALVRRMIEEVEKPQKLDDLQKTAKTVFGITLSDKPAQFNFINNLIQQYSHEQDDNTIDGDSEELT